jgi:hypothetical protein
MVKLWLIAIYPRTDRRSVDGRLNREEVSQACAVLNTAHYCAETTMQLEERLKQKISPDLRSRVSLQSENELFTTCVTCLYERFTVTLTLVWFVCSVTTTAILALLKELEVSCEPAFNAMLRSPWKDHTLVSSESQYIVDMTDAINRVADIVKTEVEQRKYYRSFCDRVVG